MTSFYDSKEGVETWLAIGRRHRLRDVQFLRRIQRWFKPGSIHEAGAACGHLSEILRDMGWSISSSDLSTAFVEQMKSAGLDARRYDATKLDEETSERFDNVLAQGLTPLSVRDEGINLKTISGIHSVLEDGGRLVSIFSIKRDDYNREHYLQPDEQIERIVATGQFRLIRVIKHQVVPPGLYRPWNAWLLNQCDFVLAHIWCNRKVMVFEKI